MVEERSTLQYCSWCRSPSSKPFFNILTPFPKGADWSMTPYRFSRLGANLESDSLSLRMQHYK